jgi:hypothetical protein
MCPLFCQHAALLKSRRAAGYVLIKVFSICPIPEVSIPCPAASFGNVIPYTLHKNHILFERLYITRLLDVQPKYQTTITGMELFQKKVGDPCFVPRKKH